MVTVVTQKERLVFPKVQYQGFYRSTAIYATFLEEYYCDTVSYPDDTTPCICDTDLNIVVSKLKYFSLQLFKWIGENHFSANGGKCHLLVTIYKQMCFDNESNIITSSQKKMFQV